MPVRLLLSMFAAATMFLLLAFTSDLWTGNWIKMDIRQVQIPAYLVGENTAQCQHSSEILVIDHMLDPARPLRLQAAMEQLHNTAQDPFWQPWLDVFVPKAIWLNPTDFSIGTAENAVKVDRRTRRIEVRYPTDPDASGLSPSLKLIYDLQLQPSNDGQAKVVIKSNLAASTTPIPLQTLQNQQEPESESTSAVVSACVAAALPIFRPDLQWELTPVEGEIYCLLQGKTGDTSLMNFERSCPASHH
jgi:hypothetical protein